jgi:D-aminoacyl-tRNA deacylase
VRALIQRVSSASVTIDGAVHGSIGTGYAVFLGVKSDDDFMEAEYLAQRCVDLRAFEDDIGKMNVSLEDIGGEILVISQFTLHADTRKGNRPSFVHAAPPELAETLYDHFVACVRERLGKDRVKTGQFRAMMDVALVNTGPVTIILKSKSEYVRSAAAD